jgi:hypothetical protein
VELLCWNTTGNQNFPVGAKPTEKYKNQFFYTDKKTPTEQERQKNKKNPCRSNNFSISGPISPLVLHRQKNPPASTRKFMATRSRIHSLSQVTDMKKFPVLWFHVRWERKIIKESQIFLGEKNLNFLGIKEKSCMVSDFVCRYRATNRKLRNFSVGWYLTDRNIFVSSTER